MAKRTNRPTSGLDFQGQQFKDQKARQFHDDMGINAQVERHTIETDLSHELADKLRTLGTKANPMPDDMVYMGSMAVHIYHTEALGQLAFVSQTSTLNKTTEQVAIRAMQDLNGAAMEHFGHERPKLRSGF